MCRHSIHFVACSEKITHDAVCGRIHGTTCGTSSLTISYYAGGRRPYTKVEWAPSVSTPPLGAPVMNGKIHGCTHGTSTNTIGVRGANCHVFPLRMVFRWFSYGVRMVFWNSVGFAIRVHVISELQCTSTP